MSNIVVGIDSWLRIRRDNKDPRGDLSWVVCTLSDNSEIYLCTSEKFNEIFDYCYENNLYILSAGLQFRSHKINIDMDNAEAVYITKSARGRFGGDTTYCVTIGKLLDGIVYKETYCIPELIKINDSNDSVENCFKELMIYKNEETKTRTIQ